MEYQINKSNFSSFDVMELNKLAARSYFIPYPDRASCDAVSLKEKRYASPKAICLNGKWDFCFYPNPNDLPDTADTEKISFDQIDVPACWQFRGYDQPFYLNTRYQFPYNPPVIPTTEKVGPTFSWQGVDNHNMPSIRKPEKEFYNFAGLYRRFITITDEAASYIIAFYGVASCLDLYVNGEFVGYSEGAHNIAEFDLSSYLKEGENELVAVVRRWCNGTYLEAQDMFRNNGIFRDVMLYKYDEIDFWDVDFTCHKTTIGYTAEMTAVITGNLPVTFTLKGHGIDRSVKVKPEAFTSKGGTRYYTIRASFENLHVQEWNAEDPTLYDLYYEIPGISCVKSRVGFKTLAIEGNLFKVNGRLIKFHGVNHHDTSCTNGYTMTPDEIERDVLLCKEFNIDTIRTSHYPPDPLLIELADEYGIYIVDEADLETHGVFSMKLPPSYNWISNDPKWKPRYVDRAKRLYQRDKCHVSIVMWSLGNESGAGVCTDAEADYLHAHSDIPVHYESAVHDKRKAYDVASQMYPSVKDVHAVGAGTHRTKQFLDRPYFLCEYAHAMGVGPGNIEAYWKEIYQYDCLMGGCIWEMVDHAVLHEDGSYTYGGDHGEWMHDGNFCVDGIFYPDRTPSTGAVLARFTYRPIRISYKGKGVFELFNTTAFSEGSRYSIRGIRSDGSSVTVAPTAGPLTKQRFKMNLKDCWNVTFITTDTKTGKVVSEEQVLVRKLPVLTEAELVEGKTRHSQALENSGLLTEPSEEPADRTGLYASDINMHEGRIHVGKLVAGDPYTILFRAGTDNDANLAGMKTMPPFYGEQEKVLSARPVEKGLEVKTQISCNGNRMTCTDLYTDTPQGVLVTSTLHVDFGHGNLPRFGKTFVLPADFTRVDYMGRCGESYKDMRRQYPIKKVSCQVSDMTEPNIRPQESGNRCDCSYVTLSNEAGEKVTITAIDAPFELGIKPYSDRELIEMKHREDEKVTGTYVTIQAFQMGIGTGSCGPMTAPEDCYPAKGEYVLKFLIS